MVKNTRAKGSRFEREVKEVLITEDYFVIRQAASVFPDLLAIKKGETLAIECKTNKYINAEERAKFAFLEAYFDKLMITYPIIVTKPRKAKFVVFCDLQYKELMRFPIIKLQKKVKKIEKRKD